MQSEKQTETKGTRGSLLTFGYVEAVHIVSAYVSPDLVELLGEERPLVTARLDHHVGHAHLVLPQGAEHR